MIPPIIKNFLSKSTQVDTEFTVLDFFVCVHQQNTLFLPAEVHAVKSVPIVQIRNKVDPSYVSQQRFSHVPSGHLGMVKNSLTRHINLHL